MHLKSKFYEAFQGGDVREDNARIICVKLQKVLHSQDRDFSTSEKEEIAIRSAKSIVKSYFDEGKPKQANAVIDHLKWDFPKIKWDFDFKGKDSGVSKNPLAQMTRT
ncbi:MAG: hypothetical protein KGH53_02030 [Candidatus Micrarchaeota archaeon]|nr:hypothetical protein [Candidatus Micrarchaeota archaeon]